MTHYYCMGHRICYVMQVNVRCKQKHRLRKSPLSDTNIIGHKHAYRDAVCNKFIIEDFLPHKLQQTPFSFSLIQAFCKLLCLPGPLGNLCTEMHYWERKKRRKKKKRRKRRKMPLSSTHIHTHYRAIYLIDKFWLFHTIATSTKHSRLGEEGKYNVGTNACRCGNRGGCKFPLNLVPNGVVFFQ